MPFFKTVVYPFGAIGFCVLTYFVIVGTSNAVNLTDGLDGLAALPVVLVSAALAVFAYVAGHAVFAVSGLAAYSRRARGGGVLRRHVRCLSGVSCGSTPTRRRCLWATSARWPWARPWARWR